MYTRRIGVALAAGLFLLLALSAVSASAASDWIVNGKSLEGSAALAKTAEVMENGKLKFSETTIECVGKNLEGASPQIEANDKGSATSLTFTECSTTTGSNCSLVGQPVNISTVALAILVETQGDLEVTSTFKPKTKTTFATLNFTGASCALSGIQVITGSAKVTGPTGQMEQTLQEIIANTVSGELKVGTAAATLQGKALLRLASGSPWAFEEYLDKGGSSSEQGALLDVYDNPLDLAVVIRRVINIGGGSILGGTCTPGLLMAALTSCTVLQDEPSGARIPFRRE